MSGINGPAVYSCPWCGRFVEQGESCWCKQSQEEAMTRQEIRAALKEARAENARLEAGRDRLQARVRELEESSDEEVIRSQYATRRAVERAVAAERERDMLREALVFARDFIMSGPRPGDEMMAVQRISAALKPAGGE